MTKVLDTIVILVLKNSVVFTRYNVIKYTLHLQLEITTFKMDILRFLRPVCIDMICQ